MHSVIRVSILTMLLLSMACRDAPADYDVEGKLKKTMTEYLYKSVNYDSSQVKYKVLNVIYFEEKNYYRCEFNVQMIRSTGLDTIGTMTADISKNFQKVGRRS